jgi:hypothetical protein
MSEFKGKYYGSIFIHYQPVDKAVWNYTVDDVIEAIPPHWRDGIKEDKGSGWAGCVSAHIYIQQYTPLQILIWRIFTCAYMHIYILYI